MTTMRAIAALTLMFLRPAIRQPWLTLLVSVLPVSFIVIFRLIGGAELSRHALFGTLIVFAANVGIVSMPQVAVSFQIRRIKDMFVASPVGPLTYASGLGLSRLAWVAPGLVIILVFLVQTGGLELVQVPAVSLVVVVTWFTGVMIGFTTATIFNNTFMIGMAANMMGMLFSVLPPVYYPMDLLPQAWRWVAFLLPTSNAAQLVRVSGGISDSTPMLYSLHWIILIGYAVLCTYITIRRSHWREA